MSSNDTGALALAALANAAGLVVVVAMWRRHRRRRRALRSRHPAARPPLQVELVDVGPGRRIRLAVPSGAPELAIDIVSFRHRERPDPWESEPLVGPLVIAPGREAVLASVLDPEPAAVDVVVAWTARRGTDAATGSQLFRIPPEPDAPTSPRPLTGFSGRAAIALILITLGAGLLVGLSVTDRGDAGGSAPPPPERPPATEAPADPTTATTPGSTATATPTATPTTTATATPTPTATPTATATPATTPTATPTATATPATTATPETTTTSAVASRSTSVAPTTATDPGEPVVQAEGRIAACRFGDECLVVDFTIAGFDEPPTEYVCEFDDGSRFTFRFDSGGVVDACATGGPDESITVEVGGVRSATVTRSDALSP